MGNAFKVNCRNGINLKNLKYLLSLDSDELLRASLSLGEINFNHDDQDVNAYLDTGVLNNSELFPYLLRSFSNDGVLYTMKYCSEDTLIRIINITNSSYRNARTHSKARRIACSVLELLIMGNSDMRIEDVIRSCIMFDIMNYDPDLMKRLDECSGIERYILEMKLKDNSKYEWYRGN